MRKVQLVAELEAEIDDLRDSAELCRKIDIAAKAAMGVGVALLFVSFFWFSASALAIGIAAVPGSLALLGSNRGSLGEVIKGIRLAEARRAEVIDSWSLRPSGPRTIRAVLVEQCGNCHCLCNCAQAGTRSALPT